MIISTVTISLCVCLLLSLPLEVCLCRGCPVQDAHVPVMMMQGPVYLINAQKMDGAVLTLDVELGGVS